MTSVQFPRLKDWQQFERLCLAIMNARGNASFQRHGRGGQRQNGVDILGYDAAGCVIAVQCKSRQEDGAIPYHKGSVDAAVSEIATFPGKISELHLMTTAPPDAQIEAYAAELTNANFGAPKVYVWGWQTICDELKKHPQIVKRFYGWGRQATIVTVSVTGLLALIVGLTLIYSNARVTTGMEINNATAADLRSSVNDLSSVEGKFAGCERLYSSYAFIYYEALNRDCAIPIKGELKLLDDAKQRFSATMTQDALQEFSTVLAAIDAQAALDRNAVTRTRLFEDEIAASWIKFCDIGETHLTALNVFESNQNQKLGREALNWPGPA